MPLIQKGETNKMKKIISISSLDRLKRKIDLKRRVVSMPIRPSLMLKNHKVTTWVTFSRDLNQPRTAERIDEYISGSIKRFSYFKNVYFSEIEMCFDKVSSYLDVDKARLGEIVEKIEVEHRDLVSVGAFRDPVMALAS